MNKPTGYLKQKNWKTSEEIQEEQELLDSLSLKDKIKYRCNKDHGTNYILKGEDEQN